MKKHYFKVVENNIVRYMGEHSVMPMDADGELDIVSFPHEDHEYLMWDGAAVYIDAVLKAAKDAENAANSQILVLYEAMVTEVFTQMQLVFGTLNSDTAIANRETWKDMVSHASEYSVEGLKCPEVLRAADDSIMFGVGDLLNTDQKILDYANRKLDQARAYGIWRIKRLDQFQDDKNAVLGV